MAAPKQSLPNYTLLRKHQPCFISRWCLSRKGMVIYEQITKWYAILLSGRPLVRIQPGVPEAKPKVLVFRGFRRSLFSAEFGCLLIANRRLCISRLRPSLSQQFHNCHFANSHSATKAAQAVVPNAGVPKAKQGQKVSEAARFPTLFTGLSLPPRMAIRCPSRVSPLYFPNFKPVLS